MMGLQLGIITPGVRGAGDHHLTLGYTQALVASA